MTTEFGFESVDTLKVRDPKDVEQVVRAAIASEQPLEIIGHGTRRQIGQEIIQLSPHDIGQEFPNHIHFHQAEPHGAQIHWSLPTHGRGIVEEKIHRGHLDAEGTDRGLRPFRSHS